MCTSSDSVFEDAALSRLAKRRAAGIASGLRQVVLPHTGQSSQLSVDANDGNAQFLPTIDLVVSRSAWWSTRIVCEKWVVLRGGLSN